MNPTKRIAQILATIVTALTLNACATKDVDITHWDGTSAKGTIPNQNDPFMPPGWPAPMSPTAKGTYPVDTNAIDALLQQVGDESLSGPPAE